MHGELLSQAGRTWSRALSSARQTSGRYNSGDLALVPISEHGSCTVIVCVGFQPYLIIRVEVLRNSAETRVWQIKPQYFGEVGDIVNLRGSTNLTWVPMLNTDLLYVS